MNKKIKIGSLVYDSDYGMIGIVIGDHKRLPPIPSLIATSWDFIIMFENGEVLGADESPLEILS